ncbi:hypothetical protein [Methylorubrum aminovorans]
MKTGGHAPDAQDDPADLLGRSVHDERVVARLNRVGASEPDTLIVGAFAAYGRPGETGFGLSAEGLASYRETNGEPRSRVIGTEAELIVSRIDFSDADCAAPGSRAYEGPLPFGLRFGDPAEGVTEKLGAKPRRKGRSSDLPGRSPVVFVWNYEVGGLAVIVKLTAQHRLAAIYLAPLDRPTRQAREREASLRAMSGRIDPASVPRIEALRSVVPTARWREAAAEGVDMAERDIAEADRLLHCYLDAAKAAAARRSAPALHRATQRLVLGLNRINRRNGLIETLERDELGVFVEAVLTEAGFERARGEDITLTWREW